MAFKRPYSSTHSGSSFFKHPRLGGKGAPPSEPLPVGLVASPTVFSKAAPSAPPLPKKPDPKVIPLEWNLEEAKDPTTDPVPDHKSSLCRFLGKSLHISLEKGDVQFETVKVGRGGYKSTCTCPRLPRRHAQNWVGECYTDKKSAEHSAAGKALETLMGIPELVASAAMSKEERIQEKQNRIAQREQEKYARAIQQQVAASQQLVQQQQLAAYTQQVQLAHIAAQQQQQQQQAAIAAQLQQSLAASLASPSTPVLPTLSGSVALPSLSAAPNLPGITSTLLSSSPNLSNLLASLTQSKPP